MVRTKQAALAALLALGLSASALVPRAPASPGALARVAALGPAPGEASAPSGRAAYTLDAAHTAVGFRIRHLGVAHVPGRFTAFEGDLTFDPADLAATGVRATVQTASVDTAVPRRDDHLRSADFFEAETYPTMTFVSTNAQPTGPNTLRLSGDLTIRDVTRPVTFDVEAAGPVADARAGQRVGFHATATIDRRDFGITWGQTMPTGVPSLGHEVRLVLDAEAVLARD